MPAEIRKLLVANRSEIAIRVFRAAQELGIATAAVYSHEDRFCLHRFKADESYLVGRGQEPVGAYLGIDEIVQVALDAGADAIHPGYGFLSENPELAEAADRAGLVFIGPPPDVMRRLGDKVAARAVAEAAGVPVMPATGALPDDPAAVERLAADVGFPLMVKGWGGGGRGMRVVATPGELAEAVAAGRREARAAFGRDDVFLERLVERARHIEVQVLGDTHGTVVHLFERDCSVQRRHQKVVEAAPAVDLSDGQRTEVCEAAVRLARAVGYRSAGTVEFLMDADSGRFFFIEVNPRLQVEHTVTEVVTGIDIVKAQIRIATGAKIGTPESGVPPQEEIRLNGSALQCRITTEDPENRFIPDYGRISAYRGATGFGIRLDGGTAYSGAIVTPFYDSLLEKVTAWAPTRDEAIARMSRAIHEFRIRGVKTNLAFLTTLLDHPAFRAGGVTTRFIDEDPDLLSFTPRRDRATRLLSFLGDVIVERQPRGGGASPSRPPASGGGARRPGPVPRAGHEGAARRVRRHRLRRLDAGPGAPAGDRHHLPGRPPVTGRHALSHLRPAGAGPGLRRVPDRAAVARDVGRRHLRRGHALPAGGPLGAPRRLPRAGPHHRPPDAPAGRQRRGLHQLPRQRRALLRGPGGGGGHRHLPGVRLAQLGREHARRHRRRGRDRQGVRGRHLLHGRRHRPGPAPLRPALLRRPGSPAGGGRRARARHQGHGRGVQARGRPAPGERPAGGGGSARPPPHPRHVRDLGRHGARRRRGRRGRRRRRHGPHERPHVPAQPRLAGRGPAGQPARHRPAPARPRGGGHLLGGGAPVLRRLRERHAGGHGHRLPPRDARRPVHQPAGAGPGLGLESRWPAVAHAYADVNALFGDIVKVTPTSKVVGDLALHMVANGLTPADVVDPARDIAFPESVVEFFRGDLGQPAGGFPEDLQRKVLKGAAPLRVRPGAVLPDADLDAARAEAQARIRRRVSDRELASYLLYPKVFVEFAEHQRSYGDVSVLPTPAFYYGADSDDEITVDLERGKTLIIRYLAVGDPDPEGRRVLFFEVNGQPRQVRIADRSLAATAAVRRKAEAGNPAHVAAPMPGMVTGLQVHAGQRVERGDRLLSIEAMKMETAIFAERAGVVVEVVASAGTQVDGQDLLLVLAVDGG